MSDAVADALEQGLSPAEVLRCGLASLLPSLASLDGGMGSLVRPMIEKALGGLDDSAAVAIAADMSSLCAGVLTADSRRNLPIPAGGLDAG